METTLTPEPPVAAPFPMPAEPSTSRATGSRVMARLAWREMIRRPWRTVLIILMIAVPTAMAVAGAAVIRGSQSATDWGSIDLVAQTGYGNTDPGTDTASVPDIGADQVVQEQLDAKIAALPDGTRATSFVRTSGPVVLDGEATWDISLTNIDLQDSLQAERFSIIGESPEVGEIAISPAAAATHDIEVGDTLNLSRPSGSWRVSGILIDHTESWSPLALAPGFNLGRAVPQFIGGEMMADLGSLTPDRRAELEVRVGGYDPTSLNTTTHDATAFAFGWLLAMVLFFTFGIVVVAAFATSARRQLVTVGQLAATGATTRSISGMLTMQGVWNALLGGMIGTAGGIVVVGLIPREVMFSMFSTHTAAVRPLDVLVVVATAIGTGGIAAAIPGRSLAVVPVLSALAGRRPVRSLSPRFGLVGAVSYFASLGVLMLAVAAGQSGTSPLVMAAAVLGVLGILVGMCASGPMMIAVLGRIAPRLPLSLRLSTRGLARNMVRSAAVLAAIAVTAGATVSIAAALDKSVDDTGADGLADNVAIVGRSSDWVIDTPDGELAMDEFRGDPFADGDPPTVVGVTTYDYDTDLLAKVRALIPNATEAPLMRAVPTDRAARTEFAWADVSPYVATEATMTAWGWTDTGRTALAADGWVAPVDVYGNGSEIITYSTTGSATTSDEFGFGSSPSAVVGAANRWTPALITPEKVAELGWQTVEVGTLFSAPGSFTDEQFSALESLNNTVVEIGFVEPGDPPVNELVSNHWGPYLSDSSVQHQWRDVNLEHDVQVARMIVVGVSTVLTAMVAAIGLTLAAADNRRDRTVLAIVGARPSTIARTTAADAWLICVAGAVVGVPAALLATRVVSDVGDSAGSPTGIPWVIAGLQFVVIPAVVAGAAWLVATISGRISPPRLPRLD